MSDQQVSNLVKMLEQIIANNLHHGDDEQVVEIVTDHLHKFWARSMKQLIIVYANEKPKELCTIAQMAIARLETEIANAMLN